MTSAEARAPRTRRGEQTRDRLIAAARPVFEAQGFAATRMGDISAAAGVSHGTVYTYFTTKEDVLAATLSELVDQLRESIRSADLSDPVQRISNANARYLAAFSRNAALLRVVEEAAVVDDRFARILDDLRRTHVERVAHQIRRQQTQGAAHPDLDPHTAAASLCAMVEGFSRHWNGSGSAADPDGHLTLTRIWQRALGLPDPAGSDAAPTDAGRTGTTRSAGAAAAGGTSGSLVVAASSTTESPPAVAAIPPPPPSGHPRSVHPADAGSSTPQEAPDAVHR
jgi:AcrR family transcriptional regulator